MTVTLPCDCDDEEHDVETSPEFGGYGIHSRVGLCAPDVGDALPCGRLITERDLEKIVDRIHDSFVDEG